MPDVFFVLFYKSLVDWLAYDSSKETEKDNFIDNYNYLIYRIISNQGCIAYQWKYQLCDHMVSE